MSTTRKKPALVLVCSNSSHVAELERLRAWWSNETRSWLAPDTPVVRSLLDGEDWTPLPAGPFGQAAAVMRRLGHHDQLVVADTGSAGAVAIAVARSRRVASMVVESAAEPSRSVSRQVARRLTDRVLVRWPDTDRTLKVVNIGGVS